MAGIVQGILSHVMMHIARLSHNKFFKDFDNGQTCFYWGPMLLRFKSIKHNHFFGFSLNALCKPWRDPNPGLLFLRRMRRPLRHAAKARSNLRSVQVFEHSLAGMKSALRHLLKNVSEIFKFPPCGMDQGSMLISRFSPIFCEQTSVFL
jgi:hypothetical protein